MLPNATQQLMIFMANRNMKHFKRTWWNYPRSHELMALEKWHGKVIGESYLDDLRGDLKRNSWFYRWQTPRHNPENGDWAGSQARGMFTWKTVAYLAGLGTLVYRPVYEAAKRSWKPPKPTETREKPLPPKEEPPREPGENPFLDPGRDGLQPPSGPLTQDEIDRAWRKRN